MIISCEEGGKANLFINLNPKLYVIIGVITTAAAQIFLKRGGGVETYKTDWFIYILLSLFFYFCSFLTYYMALKYFNISTIQPIMMVSIVAIIALYGFTMGEKFNYVKLSGIILATLSIFLIVKS